MKEREIEIEIDIERDRERERKRKREKEREREGRGRERERESIISTNQVISIEIFLKKHNMKQDSTRQPISEQHSMRKNNL